MQQRERDAKPAAANFCMAALLRVCLPAPLQCCAGGGVPPTWRCCCSCGGGSGDGNSGVKPEFVGPAALDSFEGPPA